MVVGDRQVKTIEHFSPAEEDAAAARLVGRAPGVADHVPDTTSGFRAYNREAALGLQVVSKFTYTLETIIQAGKMTVAIDHVPVRTNPKLRESRLFPSMWTYIRRNGVSIFRIYALYEPLRVFMTAARWSSGSPRSAVWGALPLLLGRRRRRRPRAVADPRRRAVQRRDGARRARRARRPDQRPADHAAADLRARAPRSSSSSASPPSHYEPGTPETGREPTTGAHAGGHGKTEEREAVEL